ncbi:protein of unknown function [Roseateles sp. YR242]|uniref:DUF4331 family protein n=1 Tax=Roseateles sp. YR242 TaxID=1855305 RepID=UPI0008B2DB93|nr:DUF4331 family protein [Roseateles sp. YR242]SEL85800.1 protein of unknown function [Roseateles sp. YR242]
MADHNDPNAVNTIFSDIDVSAADLYDLFGFPSDDKTGPEKVYIALTFAAEPKAGTLDTDLLYRVQIAPSPRVVWPHGDDQSLETLLNYFEAVKERYLGPSSASEIRVTVDEQQRATVRFFGFPCGDFSTTIDTNQVLTIDTPDGHAIKTFIGGRDDAFFNDLTGFFRSINYAPQFYHVPHTRPDLRELPIPKTLLELEGNDLFNADPNDPDWGYLHVNGRPNGSKRDLPPGPYDWKGDRFRKDENGDYRLVYSGYDCQNGKNINAIVLEIPLAFLTKEPQKNRIVNTWGESWVRKAANKVETIPDHPFWLEHPRSVFDAFRLDDELKHYKLVDTDGQPFADAGFSEREDNRQLGANNFWLAPTFIRRTAHLGWGFGPSISALGLATCFDHDNSPVSVHKTYELVLTAFPRAKKLLFQHLRMPDDSWNPKGLDIPLRRPVEIFIPNVCAIDMDTTGTWPFGRRLEDQVANRFLAMFLDMDAEFNGHKYHLDLLNDPALWQAAPVQPKTSPNPLHNDKPFLKEFPYLAPPWPEAY